MVIIDQFRITDDGKSLLIDAHVSTAVDTSGHSLFAKVYLNTLIIKTADQVSEAASELSEDDYIYRKIFDEYDTEKEVHLVISAVELMEKYSKNDFSDDLLFLKIETKGDAEECVPCSCSSSVAETVTFDENLLYQKVMGFTKELVDECATLNRDFIDFILLWNAFKAAVETEHWTTAIKLYKILYKSGNKTNYTKSCGCHG